MSQNFGVRTVALIGLFVIPSVAQAGGFRIEAQGAAALGQGLAFSASAEDATAIYYNPAGLTRLPGTQVALYGEWIGITSHFTNRNATPPFIAAGQTERDDNSPVFPVGLYVTTNPRGDVAFGLGIFSPYGLALDWPPNGNTQFTVTHVRLQTIDVNPVLAVRVSRTLSVAVGLDLVKATADLERMARLSATVAAEFNFHDGDDLGRGVTVAVGGSPNDAWAWGIVYRSQVRLNLRGQAHLDATSITPAIDDEASIALTLPNTVSAGVAYSPIPKWVFAADGVWTDWSSTDQFDLATSNPLLAASPSTKSIRAWRDTWGARFGARYRFDSGWIVRSGYYWNPTPIPGQTLDALLPDANRHEVTMGAGYTWERTRLDLAYSHVFMAKRTTETNVNDSIIAGTSAAGTYRSHIDLIAVTVSYRF